MKLSYRERMILLGFIVIAIILVGIFVFIKPANENITASKAVLADQQSQLDEINNKISQIPALDTKIKEAYSEASKTANNFSTQLTAYELDNFIRDKINENNMELTSGLQVSEPAVVSMDYYTYAPNIITYPIFEAADINGTLAKEIEEKLLQSTVISTKTVENVLCSQIGFDCKVKRDDLLNFISGLNDLGVTIRLNNLNIQDYTFGKDAEDPKDKGYSTVTIAISLYSAQPMEEPNLD